MTAEEEPQLLDPREPAQLVRVEDAANRLLPWVSHGPMIGSSRSSDSRRRARLMTACMS